MAETENAEQKQQTNTEREGKNLLGSPTYIKLENGRFKCVETGHELPEKEKESYGHSKRCRLGLIDFAMKKKKPPLNMFKRDPNSSSKLVCKLTGDVINKSEEHIWKHLNGKQFLHKLELKEMGKLETNVAKKCEETLAGEEKENDVREKKEMKKKRDKKKKKKDRKKRKKEEKAKAKAEELGEEDGECEDVDFWVPPVGSRWDNDEGGDRWGSDSDSGDDAGNRNVYAHGEDAVEDADNSPRSEEQSRKKRIADEVESSSSKSRKKKKQDAEPAI